MIPGFSLSSGGREAGRRGPATARLLALLVGLLAIGAFLGLFEAAGFRGKIGRVFVYLSPTESLFWFAHLFLLTPGIFLVSWGLAPWLSKRCAAVAAWLCGGSLTRRRALAVGYGVSLGALALLYRHLVLLDLPVTDDEGVVLFGARMIAEGQVSVPVPEPRQVLPLHYTYVREGRISSFDYPGGLFFTALSLVTGSGAALFALVVGLSSIALPIAGAALAGRRGALAAAGFWLASPMVFTLSATAHPQLLSRSLCAVALAAYCVLLRRPRRERLPGALLGACAGLAFLCRPIESACLLTPVAAHLSHLAWRKPRRRATWLTVVLAFLPSVAAFGLYNRAVTGSPWVQARFTPQLAGDFETELTARLLLGTNLGFNFLMIVVFGLGPLGLLLAGAGLGARGISGTIGRTLAAGIALQLAVALLHPNTGIHVVGPIHYSETAVPLVLLAALGLREVARGGTALRLQPDSLRAAALALGATLFAFTAVHSLTLRGQAWTQRLTLEAIAEQNLSRAVLLTRAPYRLWDLRPELAPTRSWVIYFPPNDPWLRDDVIVAIDRMPPGFFRAAFPDRDIVRMSYHAEDPPIRFELLARAGERP